MIFAPIGSAVRELSNGENTDFFCTHIHSFQPLNIWETQISCAQTTKMWIDIFPHIFLTRKCEEKTLKCEENVRKNSKNVRKMWGKNEHNEGSPILREMQNFPQFSNYSRIAGTCGKLVCENCRFPDTNLSCFLSSSFPGKKYKNARW